MAGRFTKCLVYIFTVRLVHIFTLRLVYIFTMCPAQILKSELPAIFTTCLDCGTHILENKSSILRENQCSIIRKLLEKINDLLSESQCSILLAT